MVCVSCVHNRHQACLSKLPMVGLPCDCECPTEEPKSDLDRLHEALPGYKEMFDWVQPEDFDEATLQVFEMMRSAPNDRIEAALTAIYVLGMYNLARGLHTPPVGGFTLPSTSGNEDDT